MIGALRRLWGRTPGDGPPPARGARDWLDEGNAALARADAQEAERCYREATAADPHEARAWLNLGFVLLEREPQAALDALQRATALRRPEDDFLPDAHYLRGRAHWILGQPEPALAAFAEALRLRPGFAPALEQGVALLHALQRHAEALEWARHWVAAEADTASLLALAHALHVQGLNAEAKEALDAVLVRVPDAHEALEGRANVLLALDRPAEALADFDRLLAGGGRSVQLLASRGAALHRSGRLPEALATLDEAVGLDGTHRDALHNRAQVLQDMRRFAEAEAVYDQAVARHPRDGDLRWNRGFLRLLRGAYEGGWPDYEARWDATGAGLGKRPDCGVPWWTGTEDLRGRTILVTGEQGLGDAIQAARYIPLLQQRGAHVVVSVSPQLHSLLGNAFPGCEPVGERPIAVPDFQCMLMSLPLAFGTTVASIPATVPYLASKPALVAQWRQRLGESAAKRVGIVWSGNPAQANDRNRSMPLASLLPIAGPGVELVCLQKDVRAGDVPVLRAAPVRHFEGALTDFDQTAALIECMDVVVTVCTSVAHLAGALGKPVWLMLCFNADWRWFEDRGDSPWYPTARLFRQERQGDWHPVVAAVRAALQEP